MPLEVERFTDSESEASKICLYDALPTLVDDFTLLNVFHSLPVLTLAKVLRTILGLDLGIDTLILILIVGQLTHLKRSSGQLKTTISKLSWILCGSTGASTLCMIAELFVESPQIVSRKSHLSLKLSSIKSCTHSPIPFHKNLGSCQYLRHQYQYYFRSDHSESIRFGLLLGSQCKRRSMVSKAKKSASRRFR